LISAAFLMFIALANSVALVSLWRELRDVRAGRMRLSADSGSRGPQPGLMGRILRPLLRLVSRPRDMYLLGFLFGLGFDTASEIGLLGISAGQASQNAPLWSIMIFPALFTAGMSLVDTTDGVVMAGAYGWAYVDPARKLAYNLAVTFASVIVAVAVGGLEMLGLFAAQGSSRFWQGVAALNARSGMVGCAILAAALSCWLVSAFVYRLRRPTRRSIPAR
jgi:high-affinity nickel-transport protein